MTNEIKLLELDPEDGLDVEEAEQSLHEKALVWKRDDDYCKATILHHVSHEIQATLLKMDAAHEMMENLKRRFRPRFDHVRNIYSQLAMMSPAFFYSVLALDLEAQAVWNKLKEQQPHTWEGQIICAFLHALPEEYKEIEDNLMIEDMDDVRCEDILKQALEIEKTLKEEKLRERKVAAKQKSKSMGEQEEIARLNGEDRAPGATPEPASKRQRTSGSP